MESFCAPCWRAHPQGIHRRGAETSCPTCRVIFYSKAAARRHERDPNTRCGVSEFRCCDCDRGFTTASGLHAHLAAKHPNFRAPPPARTRGIHYCEPCNKAFETAGALGSHRAHARAHNPILKQKVGCVGVCRKKFNAPSSLLSHLESGFCKSGITRDTLDKAIIAQDKRNIITDPDAILARQTRNLTLTNSNVSSICDGAFSSWGGSGVCTPSGSSTGTVTPTAGAGGSGAISINSPPFSTMSFSSADDLYTPSASSIASNQPAAEPTLDQLRSWLLPDGTFECPICPDPPNTAITGRPSFPTFAELQAHMQSLTAHPQLNFHTFSPGPHSLPISTTSSESGISTPSTIPAHPYLLPSGKYECPLCPFGSRKQYKSLAALQTHMLSPVAHMPKIYNCPDPELLGITLSASAKRGKQKKSFATLSALAQHVEVGACQGGSSMFNAMVGFVNEKLADVGMGDRRMIPAE